MAMSACYVQGLEHDSGNPNASRVGNAVWSGGIFGYDRMAKLERKGRVFPKSIEDECDLMLKNLETIAKVAGVNIDDIGYVEFQVSERGYKKVVNQSFKKMFPNANASPASDTKVDSDLTYGRVRCRFEAHRPQT